MDFISLHSFCSITPIFSSLMYSTRDSVPSKHALKPVLTPQIILLQDQFDGSPSQIGFLYVLSNLYMFLTEFFITPFLSRHFSSLRLVRLSILLLLIGKLTQLFLSSLYSLLFLLT